MPKVHWIRDDAKTEFPRRVVTHCGITGWAAGGDEFDTAACGRIDACERLRHVTCKRCLASDERIATTRRRDRSRVRFTANASSEHDR